MELIGIRYTKSELTKIRTSNKIVAKIHEEVKSLLGPGLKTSIIEEEVSKLIRSFGCTSAFKGYKGYPYTTCISVNDTIVHGFPSTYSLQEGDLVSIDIGVVKDGYYGDACFSEVIGKNPDAKQLVLYTYQCLYDVIDMIRDGVMTGDIGHYIDTFATSRGYGVIKDFVGHNIGCVLHDAPSIKNYGKPRFGYTLKADMVICIEPMFTIGSAEYKILDNSWEVKTKDGSLAAHVEHCVLITKGGFEILSS